MSISDARADMDNLISCLQGQEDGAENVSFLEETLRTIACVVCNSTAKGRSGESICETNGLKLLQNLLLTTSSLRVREACLHAVACIIDQDVANQKYYTTPQIFMFLQELLKNSENQKYFQLIKCAVNLLAMLISQNRTGQELAREQGCLDVLMHLHQTSVPNYAVVHEHSDEGWFKGTEEASLRIWSAVNAALCSAVNNPANEENQQMVSRLFPYLLKVLDHCINRNLFCSICSFLTLAVHGNEQNQDLMGSLNAVKIFERCIQKESQLLITASASQSSETKLILLTLLAVVKLLNTTVMNHQKNAKEVGSQKLFPLLAHLLSLDVVDDQLKLKIILCCTHCAEAYDHYENIEQKGTSEKQTSQNLGIFITPTNDQNTGHSSNYLSTDWKNIQKGRLTMDHNASGANDVATMTQSVKHPQDEPSCSYTCPRKAQLDKTHSKSCHTRNSSVQSQKNQTNNGSDQQNDYVMNFADGNMDNSNRNFLKITSETGKSAKERNPSIQNGRIFPINDSQNHRSQQRDDFETNQKIIKCSFNEKEVQAGPNMDAVFSTSGQDEAQTLPIFHQHEQSTQIDKDFEEFCSSNTAPSDGHREARRGTSKSQDHFRELDTFLGNPIIDKHSNKGSAVDDNPDSPSLQDIWSMMANAQRILAEQEEKIRFTAALFAGGSEASGSESSRNVKIMKTPPAMLKKSWNSLQADGEKLEISMRQTLKDTDQQSGTCNTNQLQSSKRKHSTRQILKDTDQQPVTCKTNQLQSSKSKRPMYGRFRSSDFLPKTREVVSVDRPLSTFELCNDWLEQSTSFRLHPPSYQPSSSPPSPLDCADILNSTASDSSFLYRSASQRQNSQLSMTSEQPRNSNSDLSSDASSEMPSSSSQHISPASSIVQIDDKEGLCPGCCKPSRIDGTILNSKNYLLALETSPYTCENHRHMRKMERNFICQINKALKKLNSRKACLPNQSIATGKASSDGSLWLRNNPVMPFAMCEDRRLRKGVQLFGTDWQKILQTFKFASVRTKKELEDRWQWLQQHKLAAPHQNDIERSLTSLR